MFRSQTSKILMVVAALAALAIIVPNTNSFVILLATRALAFAILVMSLDILLGYTGLASLGQAAYLGVGAYLTAILATKYQFGLGWDFWLVVRARHPARRGARGGVRPARDPRQRRLLPDDHAGARTMRVGPRLSLEFADRRRQRHQPAASGPKFGIDLANEVTFFYLVFAFFAVSLLVMYMLVRSPFGRSLAGIRERELRMKILGYNTWLHKYIAFIIAGGVRRPVRRAVGAHRRHRQPGERRADHVGRRAADGGARRRRHAGRRRDRLVHRVRAARVSQHAGAVVAVRAGRRLRADDSLSADRADGHSGAHPAAADASKNEASRNTKKLAAATS